MRTFCKFDLGGPHQITGSLGSIPHRGPIRGLLQTKALESASGICVPKFFIHNSKAIKIEEMKEIPNSSTSC